MSNRSRTSYQHSQTSAKPGSAKVTDDRPLKVEDLTLDSIVGVDASIELPKIESTRDPDPSNVPSIVDIAVSIESIPKYRQCPLCWDRCKGVGVAYSKSGRTRYYKCKRSLTDFPPCGHTWSATVISEVTQIDNRTVTLDGER